MVKAYPVYFDSLFWLYRPLPETCPLSALTAELEHYSGSDSSCVVMNSYTLRGRYVDKGAG